MNRESKRVRIAALVRRDCGSPVVNPPSRERPSAGWEAPSSRALGWRALVDVIADGKERHHAAGRGLAGRVFFLVPLVVGLVAAAPPDPYSVAFSTFLGGSGLENLRGVAVDDQGNFYVTGGTASADFPTTAGAYATKLSTGGKSMGNGGPMDVFVAKFNPAGRLVWSTYFGGPNHDRAYAIEVDKFGYVYAAGRAGDQLPTTPGVVQPSFGGDIHPSAYYGAQNGFIAKFSPDGRRLIWSTYFGSDDGSSFRDMAIDGEGNVYGVMTVTRPNSHITPGAYQTSLGGGEDMLIVKISSDGRRVIYATYLGGSGDDGGRSLRVASDGSVYVAGVTNSQNMPTTAGAHNTRYNGAQDAYVARLSPDGRSLLFGTYLGGAHRDGTGGTHAIFLDAQGNAFVTGYTNSANFPTTVGAFQRSFAGSNSGVWELDGDFFVSKLSPTGQLLASTFLGGSAGEFPEGIGVDAVGNVYVTGMTHSRNFPTTSNAAQTTLRGGVDGVVFKLSANLDQLLYSTYMGGTAASTTEESFRAVAVDPAGNIYAGGVTDSSDWPTVNAHQGARAGGVDGTVTKFALRSAGPARHSCLHFGPIFFPCRYVRPA
jgi:beta-propeller repeat-containing protein